MDNNITSSAILSHPVVFVKDVDEAVAVINRSTRIKEFLVIADNTGKTKQFTDAFKAPNITFIRLRGSGSWNTVFRFMGQVEDAREEGKYGEATDLMIISLFSAHDIAAAMKRHRAVAHLSCREMFWLDSLKLGPEADDSVELALRDMPNVPAPVSYQSLSIEQRFALSAFEFSRYTRPVHCVESVTNLQKGTPFYTDMRFGDLYQSTQSERLIVRKNKAA